MRAGRAAAGVADRLPALAQGAEGAQHAVVDQVLGVEGVAREAQGEAEEVGAEGLDAVHEGEPGLLDPPGQPLVESVVRHLAFLPAALPGRLGASLREPLARAPGRGRVGGGEGYMGAGRGGGAPGGLLLRRCWGPEVGRRGPGGMVGVVRGRDARDVAFSFPLFRQRTTPHPEDTRTRSPVPDRRGSAPDRSPAREARP